MNRYVNQYIIVNVTKVSFPQVMNILPMEKRTFCRPFEYNFKFYNDNTLYTTNESFEILKEDPLQEFAFILQNGAQAYQYATFYFKSRYFGQVHDSLYEFTSNSAIFIAKIPNFNPKEPNDYIYHITTLNNNIIAYNNLQFYKFDFFTQKFTFMYESQIQFTYILGQNKAIAYNNMGIVELNIDDPPQDLQLTNPPLNFLHFTSGLIYLQNKNLFFILEIDVLTFFQGKIPPNFDFKTSLKPTCFGVLCPGLHEFCKLNFRGWVLKVSKARGKKDKETYKFIQENEWVGVGQDGFQYEQAEFEMNFDQIRLQNGFKKDNFLISQDRIIKVLQYPFKVSEQLLALLHNSTLTLSEQQKSNRGRKQKTDITQISLKLDSKGNPRKRGRPPLQKKEMMKSFLVVEADEDKKLVKRKQKVKQEEREEMILEDLDQVVVEEDKDLLIQQLQNEIEQLRSQVLDLTNSLQKSEMK